MHQYKQYIQGDRFIPAREEDLDIAHYYVTQNTASTTICTDSGNYASVLADSIFEGRTQSKVSNTIMKEIERKTSF